MTPQFGWSKKIQPLRFNDAPEVGELGAPSTMLAINTQNTVQPGIPETEAPQDKGSHPDHRDSQSVNQPHLQQPIPTNIQTSVSLGQATPNAGLQPTQRVPNSKSNHLNGNVQPQQPSTSAHEEQAHSDPSGQKIVPVNHFDAHSEMLHGGRFR